MHLLSAALHALWIVATIVLSDQKFLWDLGLLWKQVVYYDKTPWDAQERICYNDNENYLIATRFSLGFKSLPTKLDVLFILGKKSNLSQGSASSLNPSFLTVQSSIKAVLMTKPPSANGVHTANSGWVEGHWDFCNSSTKDIKLGKPGIFNFDSLANEKILLLQISPTKFVSWRVWQMVPTAHRFPLAVSVRP